MFFYKSLLIFFYLSCRTRRFFFCSVVIVSVTVTSQQQQQQQDDDDDNDKTCDDINISTEHDCTLQYQHDDDEVVNINLDDHTALPWLLRRRRRQQAHDFGHFLEYIFDINDSYDGTNRTEQELLVLKAVMEYVNMDPTVLTQTTTTTTKTTTIDGTTTTIDGDGDDGGSIDDNWYYELYLRLTAMAPPNIFFTIYDDRPTDEETQLVAAMDRTAVRRASLRIRKDDDDRHEIQMHHDDDDDDNHEITTTTTTTSGPRFNEVLRQEGFRRYRHRGGTTRQGRIFRSIVCDPLSYWVGFAIPNPNVLTRIATYSPLIEMGAGTAYWTALLQQRPGVDIVAYDSVPPNHDDAHNDGNRNLYFHDTFTTVLPGTCTDVFASDDDGIDDYAHRTLLLIWPNNPDNVDNVAFASSSLPPVWDVDCVRAYMAVGGTTVIFVGEREVNIPLLPGAPPDSGMTATREFQLLLQEHFVLVEQIDIPHWWSSDDATIWKLRPTVL